MALKSSSAFTSELSVMMHWKGNGTLCEYNIEGCSSSIIKPYRDGCRADKVQFLMQSIKKKIIYDIICLTYFSGKFREEFKAAFSCHCNEQGQDKTIRIRARTSTDSRKSLSTQVNNMDNVSRISDQIV